VTDSVTGGLVEEMRASLRRAQAVVHGPVTPADAVSLVVERSAALAADASVAVPATDDVLDATDLLTSLRHAGLSLLTPDDPDWRARLPGALVGVTGALAGIAESGTLALGCGPGRPRAVSLTPDTHLCLLPVERIEPDFAAAFARASASGLPPALVWVSGPSRSADIEKRITMGVHGPRSVEVVLVES
jgi:L-lactate utilization protein LutC